ncbi:hypothetical protein STAS_16482 [Striga asiatica]|uniref:Probable magnesium transporter n=1 Tax=Striga asiatica TaxID=4170 RepID=A0A5A7Q5X7_STRAF|nr:hypothetical protein STAS_16482 [Striga asiatica]
MASIGVGELAATTSNAYKGMSSDNIKGLGLALSSSVFIGASFIVKKKGLKKAGASGVRAGVGGYSYLYEPLWWIGMITMIVGEIANFAAYAFAPAIVVTPLGALSIIIRHDAIAILAHIILQERLHIFGILGCALCVVGSTAIVLHAPQERDIQSVKEVWDLATEPGPRHVQYCCGFAYILRYVYIFNHIGERDYVQAFVCDDGQDWDRQNPTQIVTEMCGFVTILSGTFLLHKTKDMADEFYKGCAFNGGATSIAMKLPKHADEDGFAQEGIPLRLKESSRTP